MKLCKKTLHINGADRMFICNPEKDTLADVLRRLGLTGTKVGCNKGICGACSVILDGQVVRSCIKKIKNIADYSTVLTIEGIGNPLHLHPLQFAFMHYGAVQCGFCSPGFIVSAYALLEQNNNPTREEVRDWFQKTKNVCRCTGYKQIVDAVMAAAKVVRGEATMDDIRRYDENAHDLYGKPMVRPAALSKVCGVADYGDDIDNCPKNMKELKRLDSWEATLSGTALTIDTASATQMTGAADASGNKVTPRNDVKLTDFSDVWWVGNYGEDGCAAVHLINALSTDGFSLQTGNKAKGQFTFAFTGHYSIDSQDTPPFELYIVKTSTAVAQAADEGAAEGEAVS